MSDHRRPNDGPNRPDRDLRWEGDRDDWPDATRAAAYEPPRRDPSPPAPIPAASAPAPPLESGDPATAFNGSAFSGTTWDPKVHGERRRPTTAEQAVPWLIGIVLALAGIVIVLMALIFTGPDGLLADTFGSPSPTVQPSLRAVGSVEPSVEAKSTPTAQPSSPEPEGTPKPTATPAPEYGPLEMVYLGRPSALAPIQLLRRDFSRRRDPNVMAQTDVGVSRYAWSPDGRYGAAIIGERLVAIERGRAARALADGISAVTFSLDSETVYAVRIRGGGANDEAEVLEVAFRRGNERRLAVVRYARPAVAPDPPLREAQFIDDGGQVRLYPLADGDLLLWILGAPETYRIDAGDGSVSEARRQPVLWSPDGTRRIDLRENPNGTTDLVLRDSDGDSVAVTQVAGLVSHVRWVSSSNEIVFTLGSQSSAGGVRQDLYVWDLRDGRDPMPLTSDGVSFGAEWLGSAPNWLP